MLNPHPFLALLMILVTLSPVSAQSDETMKLPSLDDYPPEVVKHLLATFDAQREALRENGVPESAKDLPSWCGCASEQENAYPLYEEAFKAEILSKRLVLLVNAAERPCFAYPVSTLLPKRSIARYKQIDTDLFGKLRDATRLLTDETRIRLTAGDTAGAIDTLCAGFGLLDHMAQYPTAVMQLTRYACQELILGAFRDTMVSVTLTDAQLKRIAAAIDRANHPESLARAWVFEDVLYESDEPFSGAPTIHIFDGVCRAQLEAARSAVAAEQYLQSSGMAPESLDQLVPVYLNRVPVDPLDGEPLRYVHNATHFAVFSVGMDGQPPADPFAWIESDSRSERTVMLVPMVKAMKPLREMSLTYTPETPQNTKEEKAAMRLVSDQTIGSLVALRPEIVTFLAGSLEDGTAVLLADVTPDSEDGRAIPIMAGFWVKDGAVHTVNEAARSLMPTLPAAPRTITFEMLRDVVH